MHSFMLAIITAVVVYMGSFVLTTREEAVRSSGQMASLINEVTLLRVEQSAMRGNYVARQDFTDHEQRLRVLEARSREIDHSRDRR